MITIMNHLWKILSIPIRFMLMIRLTITKLILLLILACERESWKADKFMSFMGAVGEQRHRITIFSASPP